MTCYEAHPVGEVEREVIVMAPKVDYVDTNTMSLLPEPRNVSLGATQTATADTVSADTVSVDTVSVDTVSADTVSVDTVSVATVSVDTASVDTASADTVSVDTVSADTVSADTVSVYTAWESKSRGVQTNTTFEAYLWIIVTPSKAIMHRCGLACLDDLL